MGSDEFAVTGAERVQHQRRDGLAARADDGAAVLAGEDPPTGAVFAAIGDGSVSRIEFKPLGHGWFSVSWSDESCEKQAEGRAEGACESDIDGANA